MNNYPREQNDTVSVGKPWGKGRLTHDFSGPLASRNPNTGNNSKPIGFQNRFDAFDKRKNNRGFEHENNFQEVNQQNSSTRFFFHPGPKGDMEEPIFYARSATRRL